MRQLAVSLSLLCYITCLNASLSPVIFVPGDGGSQIDAKWDKPNGPRYGCTLKQPTWYNIWLNLLELSPYTIDCWASNVRLVYDNKTRTTSPPPGVETRIPGFGKSESVEYLDPSHFYGTSYFLSIAKALVSIGYKRDDTLLGAPFDFRRAPNELGQYFENLKQLIEDTYDKHQQKITLLAHSMGGPISHYFLNMQTQPWKDKHIQALIGLSAPWAGAVKSVKVYAAGYNLGHYLLPSTTLRSIQISNPSLAFLLPSANEWGQNEILAKTPEKSYSLSNIKEYFDDLHYANGYLMYEDTYKLLLNASAPGVEILCLHGIGVPTTEKVIFHSMSDFPSNPSVITGDGDGTVNMRSASFCRKWTQSAKIHWKPFRGVDHMAMLTDPNVIKYIVQYLNGVNDGNVKKSKRRMKKEKYKMKLMKRKLEFNNNIVRQARQRSQRVLAEKWLEHSQYGAGSKQL